MKNIDNVLKNATKFSNLIFLMQNKKFQIIKKEPYVINISNNIQKDIMI